MAGVRKGSAESSDNHSSFSERTNTTWRYSVFGPDRLGKGAMLFTGKLTLKLKRVKFD